MLGKPERMFHFGEFTLEVEEHRLREGESEIDLRPKAFDVLLYMVEHHGHLVRKDELMDAVWGTTIVTEAAMTHCIEEVRKALGDDAHQSSYLKTISRVGYKFIAPVSAVDSSGQGFTKSDAQHVSEMSSTSQQHAQRRVLDHLLSLWTRTSLKILILVLIGMMIVTSALYLQHMRSYLKIKSLAVLPLTNLNGDPALEYFADGMTEALITELAKISSIRVISRTSVMQYKEIQRPLADIANELRVDAIVEASILYSGDRVRITAQLLQANPERHLWAESYDRKMRDILALQKEVTRAIAEEIEAKLTPQEQANLTNVRQVDLEAYQAYLRGRFFWNKRVPESFLKSIDYFNQAISIDPGYAPAYAGLADCYNLLYDYDVMTPLEAVSRAKAAAMKALEIDTLLAEAHASLGFALTRYDWDWIGAEREFKRAIELNPNYAAAHHWYALELCMMGRFQEAMIEITEALELDPFSLIINANKGWLLFFERNYDAAEQWLQRTRELDPNFLSTRVKLGWVYEQQGFYERAIDQFTYALVLSHEEANVIALLGNSYALSGQRLAAKQIIDELKQESMRRYISSYWIAMIYACLDEKDNAFEWLTRAYKERSSGLVWLKVEPKLDILRSDPRYTELLKRIRLD